MAKRIYTEEQINWLRENAPGHFLRDTVKIFNQKFNLNLTEKKLKTLISNYRIRTGMCLKLSEEKRIERMLLTPEEIEIFKKNNFHKTAVEMAEFCKTNFNKNLTPNQIKELRNRLKISSGLTGKFQKGHTPPNKGRKGFCFPGAEKGWFKKGQKPHNTLPVGSEVITEDGYSKIKIADPDVWELKHRLIWEKEKGKIPENHMVIFKDGNKQNFDINNLFLITKAECAQLNHEQLRTEDPDFTAAAIAMIRLRSKINEYKHR